MPKSLIKAVQQAATEARYWTYAAWTLPFVALALIIFEHFIGHDDWISITLVGITTTFFSISVYWWWWALNKVVIVMAAMEKNEERFEDVLQEIKQTRQVLREIDDSNRQWREQIKN
jgi:uncharacterized Tic20 family protein